MRPGTVRVRVEKTTALQGFVQRVDLHAAGRGDPALHRVPLVRPRLPSTSDDALMAAGLQNLLVHDPPSDALAERETHRTTPATGRPRRSAEKAAAASTTPAARTARHTKGPIASAADDPPPRARPPVGECVLRPAARTPPHRRFCASDSADRFPPDRRRSAQACKPGWGSAGIRAKKSQN